ncbi:mannose-1-phosphate guanylyltransferase [candidate division WOR-3 bacterium]|uniref:mannose-1-phosphate guanylyltransferase n=1 Tax=candidate division WOR-3 bacterium TaxID=2052148 RepID=A0A660SF96_UNCW3|nr:MAG: mannose-1-phosphate guanylyltransferase [candidate division WOR-3 bacterium]
MRRIALLIAGGRGERFWPKSRYHLPKQFLSLTGPKPLIKLTYERLKGFIEHQDIWIIVPEDLKPKLKKILPRVKIITEPEGRNTAPAIAYATLKLRKSYGDAVMFVLPADHWVYRRDKFLKILSIAYQHALGGSLVTLGIKPTRPDTGYGYIQVDGRVGGNAYRVLKFKEKPDLETARHYLEIGGFYWNSGIFIWRIDRILEEFRRHMPKMMSRLEEFIRSKKKELYHKLPSISIDYGIMEKASDVVMIEANFEWDDLGTWNALARHLKTDPSGNVRVGRVCLSDSKNSIFYSDHGLIAALGVEDMIVVRTEDAVLVCPRSKANEVKTLIKKLRKEER